MKPWKQLQTTDDVKTYLTDVFDTGFHQRFILKNNNTALLNWHQLVIFHSSQNKLVTHQHLVSFELRSPQEKRFWRQSAWNPGKELFQHFPVDQRFLSATPQNLWKTLQWSWLDKPQATCTKYKAWMSMLSGEKWTCEAGKFLQVTEKR